MSFPVERVAVLKKLWEKTTSEHKHAAYQSLPVRLAHMLDSESGGYSKHEWPRLSYILSKVDVRGKRMLDIGCNTGFFLFESLAAGALYVTAYEGGEAHAAFVKLAAELLELDDQIEVHNAYFEFNESVQHYDLALLLNVLHHVGDDYGDALLGFENARKTILKQLNSMTGKVDVLVFQLGFNWHGDRRLGLFEHGTKAEMIEFIRNGTHEHWLLTDIGVAQRQADGAIQFSDLNESNIMRDDSLGEFLNRPIFILRAR